MCPRSLASSIPVLGLERFCPRKGCPWPWPRIFFVSLASSLVSSTPPLQIIIEFESRVPRPLVVHIFLKLVILMTKQKSSKANLRVHYLMLKMLQKACTLIFLTWAKSQNLTQNARF